LSASADKRDASRCDSLLRFLYLDQRTRKQEPIILKNHRALIDLLCLNAAFVLHKMKSNKIVIIP